jgi:hypothetical protein
MRGPRLGWLAITLGVMALSGGVMDAAGLIPAAVAAPATATTQCEPLPAAPTATSSPSSSASPSASASASGTQPQLCVGVQAAGATIAPGNTATWTIGISAQSGAVPGVTVTLATNPSGLAGTFTGSCPSGSGTATCTLGDMATSVTPASYQLEAEVGIPAGTPAGTLTLTATAEATTTPAMTADPGAGQSVTISAPSPTPTPASTSSSASATATTSATQTSPTTQTTTIPPATYTGPVLGSLPAPDPIASTVTSPAGSIASILPVITPQVVESTAAANVQGFASPSASTAQAGTFAVTIGMSGQTAEILGVIILALILILVATRTTATHLARARHPVTVVSVPSSPRRASRPRTPGARFSRIHRLRSRFRRSGRHVAPDDTWLSQVRIERPALLPPPPSSDAGPSGADPRETGTEGDAASSSGSRFTAVTDADDDGDREDELPAVTADLDDEPADQLAAGDAVAEPPVVADPAADPRLAPDWDGVDHEGLDAFASGEAGSRQPGRTAVAEDTEDTEDTVALDAVAEDAEGIGS